MATYIQGVTDYIPQFQPFQPDLNFYANLMQTKQSQYDTNWKALNKVYGQYFYADLTRDNNIEKKEDLLKQIDFNLKRVSGLDLSLEQNVTQATQVFKPFYEDKNLMKDMAWTKTFNRETGRANALKGSSKEEDRKQYWDTGLKDLNYRKEEFKEASDEAAMSMGNVSYTPYVNTMEKALKIAKDAGLSVESVKFSDDQRWIITQKNGQQLIEPLEKLFESTLGSDPGIQAVYKTQAYVNRKDYAFSNAGEFNGDKNAAEMKYLENSFAILKRQRDMQYKSIQKNSDVYDAKINSLQKLIDDKKAPVGSVEQLEQLKENKSINDNVLARIKKESEMFSNSQSTITTTSGWNNPYSDIATLRYKVDAGMASTLMEKDFDEAAEIYAYRDAKTSVKENPYKVLEIKHAQEMQQIHTSGSYKLRAQSMANQSRERVATAKIIADQQKLEKEQQAAYDKWGVDNGILVYEEYEQTNDLGEVILDPKTGNPKKAIRTKKNPNQSVISKTLANDMFTLVPDEKASNVVAVEEATYLNNAKEAQVATVLNAIANSLNKNSKVIPAADLARILNPDLKQPFSKGDVVQGKDLAKILAGGAGAYASVFSDNNDTKDTKLLKIENIQKGFQEKGEQYLKDLSKKYGDSYIQGLAQRMDSYYDAHSKMVPQFAADKQALTPYLDPINDFGRYENVFIKWEIEANKAVGGLLKETTLTKTITDENKNNPMYGWMWANKEDVNLRLTDDKTNLPFKTKEDFVYNNSYYFNWAKTYYKGGRAGAGVAAPGGGGQGVSYELDHYEEHVDRVYNEYLGKQNKILQGSGIPAGPAALSMSGGLINNVFQNQANSIIAYQKGGEGRTFYNDMFRSFNNVSFNGTDGVLTYGGIKQSAIDNAKDNDTQQKLNTILNDFNSSFNDFSKAESPVEIGGVLFAAGEKNKVANYIKIPKEFLDKYYNATDETKGYLSKDEYNGLITNGISAIGDKDVMMNSLIQGTYTDPLEAVLKYNKELEFVDPIGGHKLKFTVPPILNGKENLYQFETTFYHYDRETGENIEISGYEPVFTDGQDIKKTQEEFRQFSLIINEQNSNILYGLE